MHTWHLLISIFVCERVWEQMGWPEGTEREHWQNNTEENRKYRSKRQKKYKEKKVHENAEYKRRYIKNYMELIHQSVLENKKQCTGVKYRTKHSYQQVCRKSKSIGQKTIQWKFIWQFHSQLSGNLFSLIEAADNFLGAAEISESQDSSLISFKRLLIWHPGIQAILLF